MVHAPNRPPPGAPPVHINLYSDTQTRPTPAMKEAMMRAEVGDEQHGDDPTVHELCDRMAALMGKEAAMYLPSGTMCNVIAILTHCQKGDEVVAHETSHILHSEGGTHAALTGVQIMPMRGPKGMFTADDLRGAIRPKTRYTPPQRLLEVEQTANIGGGAVWPLEQLNAVAAVAHGEGWATHMDGARLMNACVAAGVAPKDMVASYDSVWLDFTKGLGAPLGAVLCGSNEFIGRAWRWKQRLGGSMRQGGICAAASIRRSIASRRMIRRSAIRSARGLASATLMPAAAAATHRTTREAAANTRDIRMDRGCMAITSSMRFGGSRSIHAQRPDDQSIERMAARGELPKAGEIA
jgi:threonine aldolase